jgi:hypothetical protein
LGFCGFWGVELFGLNLKKKKKCLRNAKTEYGWNRSFSNLSTSFLSARENLNWLRVKSALLHATLSLFAENAESLLPHKVAANLGAYELTCGKMVETLNMTTSSGKHFFANLSLPRL